MQVLVSKLVVTEVENGVIRIFKQLVQFEEIHFFDSTRYLIKNTVHRDSIEYIGCKQNEISLIEQL
ncbi:hypothetical protein BBP83_13190 [Acinetobacter celticus]|uniref:Uncharacterized protein n=1 Tax=Acinetobacter celticus TaxID=1891224 RepID=A0A1C3CT51_9GAMM|nr:hypothetical protein BBP83_13190 [Acinetobacter celticus]